MGAGERDNPFAEFERDDAYGRIAERILGPAGRLITLSKSHYAKKPGRRPVYNANVCTREQGKLWYGDLDLADPQQCRRLQLLANVLHQVVYVLPERAARFERADDPDFERAVDVYAPGPHRHEEAGR